MGTDMLKSHKELVSHKLSDIILPNVSCGCPRLPRATCRLGVAPPRRGIHFIFLDDHLPNVRLPHGLPAGVAH
jgi:hypothetical protein